MKLLVHLIAADLRRFRSTVAAWAGLILIMGIVRALTPTVAHNDALWVWLGFASGLLELAYGLFFAALVAVVVQGHSLVGTTAFWFARPIPPRMLMLSKAFVLLLVVVALPAIIDVALMARYRVPAALMVLVVGQAALAQGLAVAVVMAVAALTPNLTRFALVCIGVIVSAGLLTSLWLTLMITREGRIPRGFDTAQGGGPVPTAMRMVDWTPQVIAALLIIAACATLLRQQYTTRSVRRSAFVGMTGVCLVGLVTSFLPWRVLVPRQTVPEWAQSESAPVLTVDPATAQFNGPRRQSNSWAVVDAVAHLTGVPTSWYATARLHSATIDVAGQPTLVSPPYGYSAGLSEPQQPESPLTLAWRDALGVHDITSGGAHLSRVFLLVSRQTEIDARRGRTGTYTGDFVVDLTKLESAGTLPLSGGVFQDRDFRIAVDPRGAQGVGYGFELTARVSRSRSMFDRRHPTQYLYFLRNRVQDQAISGFSNSAPEMNPLGNLPVAWLRSAFDVAAMTLRFDVPRERENPRAADQTWLAHAELVIVRATAVGSVSRQVRFAGMLIDPEGKVTSRQ
ncbi:MAG: hypothetical protein ABIS06_03875 [Vicinamibacterales bacterium]